MNLRPDPKFHATAKLAMQAPVETLAYTLLLSPHAAGPDAQPWSTSIPTAVAVIHTTAMVIGGALMACVTCERLRMGFISRSWFNLDMLRAASLFLIGGISLLAIVVAA